MKGMKKNGIVRIAAIAAAIMLAATGSTPAADEAPRKIAVDEAVRMALANNREYRIALTRLAQAKERVNGEWGKLFPVLESEASLARQYAESGLMSLSDGQYDIRFVQIRLGVNPGIFYNSLAASRA
ncbi:MAG TPA: TolC family protein, partial [Spirochaetota bacterium]|nr:TolC family protein [Spirochaetota bacterium]